MARRKKLMPYGIFEPFQDAYMHRRFQGQAPEVAKIIIFGIDANYDPEIAEDAVFFEILKAYHADGVAYWQNNGNGDHHPFLLEQYGHKAGYQYHSMLRLMNLPADPCAESISFVELLNVPTKGDRENEDPDNLFRQLLQQSMGHIEYLNDSIFNAHDKLIFMPNEVIEILKGINRQNHSLFQGVDFRFRPAKGLPVIYHDPDRNITVRKILHFSAPFHQKQVMAQMPVMKEFILKFLR